MMGFHDIARFFSSSTENDDDKPIALTDSQQKLVADNCRLVFKFAEKYRNRGLDIEDLHQEGMRGLIDAAIQHDPKRGAFTTCAYVWIKRAFIRATRENKMVAIPDNLFDPITAIRTRKAQIAASTESVPSNEDVIKSMRVRDPKRLAVLNNAAKAMKMLNVQSTETSTRFRNTNNVREAIDREHVGSMVANLLEKLNPKQSRVVCLYYGVKHPEHNPSGEGPMTQADIAPKIGMTIGGVSMIYRSAIQRLSKLAKSCRQENVDLAYA